MVTLDQALTEDQFHANGCIRTIGKRGAEKFHIEHWRRNGVTKLWKTRHGEFSLPIKFGLRYHGYLTQNNAEHFHTDKDCPLRDKDGRF